MKPVRFMMDETLLARLDRTGEVQRDGRSAVIRRAVDAWLAGDREREIEAQYTRAHETGTALGEGWEGWETQGEWPDE
jgi:metal-responsive CopG/Arc/MetJ family transcriptional regulator